MSTGAKHSATARRAALVIGLVLGGPAPALFVIGGCWGGDDRSPPPFTPPRLVLSPVSEMVHLKPGGMAGVAFLLTTTDGTPVPGERLEFSAEDNPQTPESDLAGALLSVASGLTDAAGIGAVTVTGGLQATFPVTARQERADIATAIVFVDAGDEGTIAVIAAPVVGSKAASVVSDVDVLLFDDMSCSNLSPILPPQPVRPRRTVPLGTPAVFAIDSSLVQRAVVGQGQDTTGALRAVGCIDIPSNTVVAGSPVRVYLPLYDLVPVPRGTFLLSSRFSLAKRELTHRVALPWQDLGDCPLDPGQLWLDCAIDALGSSSGDALDCVPAAGGEGDLADLILARRGSATALSPCRSATVSVGVQGLDAKVAALFPSPPQPPASEIDTLGAAIAAMFDDIKLDSTLALSPTATPGTFQATHTLRAASFQVGAQTATVDIVAQGAPNAQVRFVPVSTIGDLLVIDTHGLGLHMGTLAHAAFAKVALVGGGLPAATGAYLDALFGLASSGTGATRTTGCDALDAVVCADVGRAAGCLRPACVAGQAALATRLDAGFALADGYDGADLQLSGSAIMTDDNGDGFADRLGATSQNSGLWTLQIRARAGTELVGASWSGIPQPP